ncbi:MAG TPA: DNRLRE domain-containing protein [Vicinamibacteria bacterium]|nr:DNRLRE domain-containing protein [Vicinamibacteria bacterium]
MVDEAEATVRRVPQDHATVQAAINAAQNGDTVLISRGTYTGGLTIAGKTITLASNYINTNDPNDITLTIIDGGNPILTIQTTVGAATTIRGLTFRNGGHQLVNRARRVNILNNRFINGNDQVSFEGAGGLVRDCFFDNAGDDGVDIDQASDPIVENNTILNSRNDGIEMRLHSYTGALLTTIMRGNFISGAREDGIQLIDYPGLSSRLIRIERNVIVNSAMVGLGCMPDGISNENFGGAPLQEEVQVINNTFSGNLYGLTGGDKMLVMNNIFANSPQVGVKRVPAPSLVTYNDFWNNGTEHAGSNVNINTSLFADPLLQSSYRLQSGSPCIDAGLASIMFNGHTVNAPSYTGSAPDLGALEGAGSGGGGQPGLPTVTISVTDGVAAEAETNPGKFRISRTGATSASLTVQYAIGGSATNGADYQTIGTSVTIAAGSASRVVRITPIDDTVADANEQVTLTLSASSSYSVGSPSSASLTITDNDSATGATRSFQDGVSPASSYAGTKDTYISEPNPTSKFGTATTLRVDGDAGSGQDLSTLLTWDISSIPSGRTVQTATITILVTNKSAQPYQVFELKRPWVEGQASWNVYATGSAWSVPGAKGSLDRGSTVLGTVAASALGSYTFTLNSSGVALVQSWVNAPSSNNGLIIANTTSSDDLIFSARHVSTTANRPKLTVTYVGGP